MRLTQPIARPSRAGLAFRRHVAAHTDGGVATLPAQGPASRVPHSPEPKNPTEFAFPNNPALLPCSAKHHFRKSRRRARPASLHTAGTDFGQYCRRRARPPLPRPATCPPVPAFTRPAACPPAVPASPFAPSAQPSGCPPARPPTSPLQAFHTCLTRMCHLGRRRRHAHFAGILVPPLPGGRQDRGGGPTGRRTAKRRVGRYGGRARGQDWGRKFP